MPAQQQHQGVTGNCIAKPEKGIENFGSSKAYEYATMDQLSKQLVASAKIGSEDKINTGLSIVATRTSTRTTTTETDDHPETMNRLDYDCDCDCNYNYTDIVKQKYFERQHEAVDNGYAISFPVIDDADGDGVEGSIHERIPSRILSDHLWTPASEQSPLSSLGGVPSVDAGLLMPSHEPILKLKMLGSNDRSTRTKPSCPHTPPLTLYANEGGYLPFSLSSSEHPSTPHADHDDDDRDHCEDNPATDEIVGYLSPGPGMDMDHIADDSAEDQPQRRHSEHNVHAHVHAQAQAQSHAQAHSPRSPTSQPVGIPVEPPASLLASEMAMTRSNSINSNSNSNSPYPFGLHSQNSVDSSKGSFSTAATHSMTKQRPLLYSAIGSLEHANLNSLTNLNKRFLAPSKEFCRPGRAPGTVHSSILIPPANPVGQRNNEHKQHRTESSSIVLQGTKPGADQGTNSHQHQGKHRDTNHTAVSTHATNREIHDTKYDNTESNDSLTANRRPADKSYQRARSGDSNPIDASRSSQHETRDKKSVERTNNPKKNVRMSLDSNPTSRKSKSKLTRKVSHDSNGRTKKSSKSPKKIEMFRPSSDAYTPRIGRKKIKYKAAEARPSVQQMSSPMGTLQRPNFRDALRRVAMIIHQHIVKIESRFEHQGNFNSNGSGNFNGATTTRRKAATSDGLFHASMRDVFTEEAYRTPTYKCNMVRIPMARPGMVYGMRKVKVHYSIPTETEIYEFGHQLFKSVQLSSECSIVCLIYVERLMEVAKVPLLACTWRPIFMCGLLLASKVWQDLSSWNIEFSSVYPQFSLESINKLELNFLRNVKWDLYISSSCYAKYYFALRSLVEKQDFRQRYNRMVGGVGNVAQEEALKVQERTERVKEEALLHLSRSMIW